MLNQYFLYTFYILCMKHEIFTVVSGREHEFGHPCLDS